MCPKKSDSRFVTCPGQCALKQTSKSQTCPGQRARQNRNCKSCPGQLALKHNTRGNCPGQTQGLRSKSTPSSHSVERHASQERDFEEVKFWCHSIGIKNLRDCITDAPRSVAAFNVPQSDWWREPGISHRREALRELTTCDLAQIEDTRCLRDTEGSAANHPGANT